MSTQQKHVTFDDTNLAKHTITDYSYRIRKFFEFSGIKNVDELIEIPKKDLQNILSEYTKHLKKRVEQNELSPNTVPKMFKPIKYLLDVNYREHDIAWKPLRALFPPKEKLSGYKPWTTEQIQEMVKYAKTPRNTALIYFMADIGGRVGIHDHSLLIKHLVEMKSEKYGQCYGVLLYAESDETPEEKDARILDGGQTDSEDYSYYGFLTPEGTKNLKKYFRQRERNGEELTPDSPIFRNKHGARYWNGKIKQLTVAGVKTVIGRIVTSTSINRNKKGRRYDVQLDHGFRKRFNTILKLQNQVNSNIAEKLMAHKNGLDGTYLVPTKEQCFVEYEKAIPELTISDSSRLEIKNQIQEKKMDELQFDKNKITKLESDLKDIHIILNEIQKRISENSQN